MAPQDPAGKRAGEGAPEEAHQDSFAAQFDRELTEVESWRPDTPGDRVIGELVDIDARTTEYSRRANDVPVLTIRNEADGAYYEVWCFHAVLKSEVVKRRPRVGERVAIQYLGKDDAGGYMRYRVKVDRTDAEFNWASVAPDPDELPPETFTTAQPEKPKPAPNPFPDDDRMPWEADQ